MLVTGTHSDHWGKMAADWLCKELNRERILPWQLSQNLFFFYIILPTSSVYWTALQQKWVTKRNGSPSICQTNPIWCELVSANLLAHFFLKMKHLVGKYYDVISLRNMYLNPKRLLLAGLETNKKTVLPELELSIWVILCFKTPNAAQTQQYIQANQNKGSQRIHSFCNFLVCVNMQDWCLWWCFFIVLHQCCFWDDQKKKNSIWTAPNRQNVQTKTQTKDYVSALKR